MTQNNHPNRPEREAPVRLSGAITQQVLDLFGNSSKYAQWGIEALAALLILYTLPHNAHAFGIEQIFSFGTLGLLVIELSFALAGLHFTRGWLSDKTHTGAASISLTVSTLILTFNSAVSQYLYVVENPALVPDPLLAQLVEVYRIFFLPATPILSVLLALVLVSAHPAVRSLGEKFRHIALTTEMKRRSQLKRDKAVYARESAEAERETARGALTVSKIKREAKQYESEADFAQATLESILGGRTTEREKILKSDAWSELVNQVEHLQLIKQLDEMYPEIPVQQFVTAAGALVNPAELQEQIDLLQQAIENEQEVSAVSAEQLKTALEQLDASRAENARLQEELANRPLEEEEPLIYTNGSAD